MSARTPGPLPRQATPHRILIIGIGSPVGDDRIGLVAAERLCRQELGADVAVQAAERPGIRLIDLWSPGDDVILIDAVHVGARPGSLFRILAERIESTTSPCSTHGIGVAEAIGLARVLGRLPRRLVLFGVEIAPSPRGAELSPGIRAALPGLIERVVRETRWLQHARAITE